METELAQLSLNEEKEKILQIQSDQRTQTEVGDYQLVGCFLTAKRLLGNFIGVFLEYDGSDLGKENRNYLRVRVQIDVRKPLRRKKQTKMMMGTDLTEMGWDLSLQAPSRRALSMNSIWLREEGEGDREGCWMENRSRGLSPRNRDPKGNKQKEKLWPHQTNALMDHNLEDEAVMGEEGKNEIGKTSVFTKDKSFPNSLLYEDKTQQMELVRRRCGYLNGI
ncbi:hypothetical protein Goshw_017725, partial [Gossypium schwendimanii]|nr:hypothetical protein [Gossypium schwendimanii]